MRLLVDAQLPVRLADVLAASGHDVVHTRELPDGNRTSDREIVRIADDQRRVVVTKDHDFLDSHVLERGPAALLLVSTGNITNDELIRVFEASVDLLVDAFESATLVELTRDVVIVHR
jgi:predicted nuclease of predicted toxin-antitoxin system